MNTNVYEALEHLFRYRELPMSKAGVLNDIISAALDRGIVIIEDNTLKLLKPFDMLLLLIEKGIEPTRFVDYVDWREFEMFVARVLEEIGFETFVELEHRGFKRFQIDVLALDLVKKLALVIECKQWRRVYSRFRSLREAVIRHLERVELLNRYCEWIVVRIPKLRKIRSFIPVIALLKPIHNKVLEGVPLVGIFELNDFVTNIDVYVEELQLRIIPNRCFVS